MDEKLRLVIELQNRASAELKKFGKDLEGVKLGAGAKATASWFQTLESASTASTKALRPLVGGLSMVGAGGLAAGLSVAGLVQQFRDLARAMPAMQELSRQTGISKTELARLQYAASRLHLDPSQMTNAIGSWSTGMVQFSKATGEIYFEMQNGSAGLAQKIAKEWRDHPEAAFKDTLAWLAAIPEAQRRAGKSAQEAAQIQKYWVGKTLGDEGMAQFFGKGMEGITSALDEAAKRVAPITDDLERAAEKFDDSITNLNTSWANIVRDLGPSFLDPLSHTIDHLDEVIKAGERMFQHAPEPEPARKPDGKAGETIPEWLARVGRNTLRAQFNGSGLAADGEAAVNALGSLFGVGEAKAGELPGGRSDAARGAVPFDDDRLSRARAGDMPAAHTMLAPPRGLDYRAVLDFLDPNLGNAVLGPEREPAPPAPSGMSPSAVGFHPDDDRGSRARASDAPDRSLDGFAVGELGREVIHLRDTLKTADRGGDGPVHQAAFHGAGFNGIAAGLDPEATIAAGTRRGFVDAFREIQGLQDLDGKGGGFMPASYGGAGGAGGYSAAAAGGHPGAPNMRYGTGGHSPAAAGRIGGGSNGGPGFRFAGALGANGVGTLNVPYGGSLDADPGGGLTPRQLHDYLKAHGATDNEALMLTGAAGNESGYNPRAVHDVGSKNGPGHGLWGHNDHRINMTGLSWQQQADKALAEVKREYAGTVNAAKTPEELADAEAGYERPQGYHTNNPRGAHNYTGRLNTLRRYGNEFGTMKNNGAEARPMPQSGPPNTGVSPAAAGHIDGVLKMGDESFRYGSGGRNGAAHIPFGDHEITPGAVGAWGASHGAMGLDGNAMWDPALKRIRTGIELHAAKSAELITSGCLGFMEQQYPRLKSRVGEMIAKTSRAYLHIDEKGASITPSPHVAPMPEIKPEPPPVQTDHRVSMDPLHVNLTHTEAGRTRVAVKHGEGVKVTLRTAPTMVETA